MQILDPSFSYMLIKILIETVIKSCLKMQNSVGFLEFCNKTSQKKAPTLKFSYASFAASDSNLEAQAWNLNASWVTHLTRRVT
jgi:hypothetical protein